jgi:predicted alpha/beta hydrolase family esterase
MFLESGPAAPPAMALDDLPEDKMRGLIVPGLNGSGLTHWQTLLQQRYKFERVEQQDWANPDAIAWTKMLDEAIVTGLDKTVLIAHSIGCWTVIHWAALYPERSSRVHAALLVAPPDLASIISLPTSAADFIRHRKKHLPFPSILVGSENDPYMKIERAQALAEAIGSRFVNAGFVGHINAESGHGPWPLGDVLLQRLMNTDRKDGNLNSSSSLFE